MVVGRSLAVSDLCLVLLSSSRNRGWRWTLWKTVGGFPRTGGRVRASTGPAASTASFFVPASLVVCPGHRCRGEARRTSARSRQRRKTGRPSGHPTGRSLILGHPERSFRSGSRGGLRSVRFPPALRLLGPEAGDIEFQQHGVMHQTIDRRGRRHLITKDPIPLGEH